MGPPRRSRAGYRLSGTFAMMFLASTLFKVMEFLSILVHPRGGICAGSFDDRVRPRSPPEPRRHIAELPRDRPHAPHPVETRGVPQAIFLRDGSRRMRSIAQHRVPACVQIAPDRPSIAGAPANKRFGNGASHLKIDFKGVHQTGSTPQRPHRAEFATSEIKCSLDPSTR